VEALELAGMLGTWAPPDAGGLAQRLTLSLRHLIESGLLPVGARLPPERSLATALHVSRPTVSAVMAELRVLGLVESRQGSGTRVARRQGGPAARPPFFEAATLSGVINLAAAMPFDASHLGDVSLGLSDLLAVSPPSGLDGQGLELLRDAVAARVLTTSPASRVGAGSVVVTSGAHQALAMIVACLVRPGGRVLAESLTYGGLADIVESRQAALVGVEHDALGMVPEDLDDKLTRYRPDLVALVANLHSPTGRAVPASRLDELAPVLDRHGAVAVTDGTYDELTYGRAIPGLASRCRAAEVISVGSLSKIGWSGLRIGWLVAGPERVRDLVRLRSTRWDFGPSVPAQLIGLQVLDRLDEIRGHRCPRLSAIAGDVVDRLGDLVPEWRVEPPDGGLTLWIELPVSDAAPLVAEGFRAGVAVLAGAASRADRGCDGHIRLCFDRPDHLLDEALERLAAAWRRVRRPDPGASRR
jgi:DNA-binding transcriptional MocR family regulator